MMMMAMLGVRSGGTRVTSSLASLALRANAHRQAIPPLPPPPPRDDKSGNIDIKDAEERTLSRDEIDRELKKLDAEFDAMFTVESLYSLLDKSVDDILKEEGFPNGLPSFDREARVLVSDSDSEYNSYSREANQYSELSDSMDDTSDSGYSDDQSIDPIDEAVRHFEDEDFK